VNIFNNRWPPPRHSPTYVIDRIAVEGGVWVRAYRAWSHGVWTVWYDVLTGPASWLGSDAEHAGKILREMCSLLPADARMRLRLADRKLRESVNGCLRTRKLP